jgi:murein DD-endopeptidase MepM/ murein hydrolase activator NlpD
MLGTGMNAKPGVRTLKIRADSAGQTRTYQKLVEIVPRAFPKEALSVAPKMNKPPEAVLARIKRELAAMKGALREVSPERLWEVPFHRPVEGVMLSRFGLHRTYNQETKRRHTGLDFRAPLGTDIKAIAAGKVLLVGEFYLPGNTVVIDHGNGVVSMCMHLSEVLVSEGDLVKRGQTFGRSGATGRVTGAHLHLSVSVQGVTVDPAPLFERDTLAGAAAALQLK